MMSLGSLQTPFWKHVLCAETVEAKSKESKELPGFMLGLIAGVFLHTFALYIYTLVGGR